MSQQFPRSQRMDDAACSPSVAFAPWVPRKVSLRGLPDSQRLILTEPPAAPQ